MSRYTVLAVAVLALGVKWAGQTEVDQKTMSSLEDLEMAHLALADVLADSPFRAKYTGLLAATSNECRLRRRFTHGWVVYEPDSREVAARILVLTPEDKAPQDPRDGRKLGTLHVALKEKNGIICSFMGRDITLDMMAKRFNSRLKAGTE